MRTGSEDSFSFVGRSQMLDSSAKWLHVFNEPTPVSSIWFGDTYHTLEPHAACTHNHTCSTSSYWRMHHGHIRTLLHSVTPGTCSRHSGAPPRRIYSRISTSALKYFQHCRSRVGLTRETTWLETLTVAYSRGCTDTPCRLHRGPRVRYTWGSCRNPEATAPHIMGICSVAVRHRITDPRGC